jgi:Tfp pilus assembly protein PilX
MARTRPMHGAATLLFSATLLLLAAFAAAATLQFLLSTRQLATLQLDREIAFRAAEVALLDGEADILAAVAGTGPPERLDPLPASGTCGKGSQAGVCVPAPDSVPVWQAWLSGMGLTDDVGIPFGTFTGNAMPVLPQGAAGTAIPPRYVAELIGDTTVSSGYGLRPAMPRFRVTAIGFGRSRETSAVVQSVIQP